MKQIIFLICIATLLACKKDKVEPQNSLLVQKHSIYIGATTLNPGSGGNQIEYSFNDGGTTIISFAGSINIDTAAYSGDSYYIKISSLDYTQRINGQINKNGQTINSDQCDRDKSTPNNCSITLTGTIP